MAKNVLGLHAVYYFAFMALKINTFRKLTINWRFHDFVNQINTYRVLQ